MKNVYKQLRRLNEDLLLEYNRQDLKKWAGDELTNRYFAIRDRLQAPENDLSYWIKKGSLEDFEKFVSDWETGNLKSKNQKDKEIKEEGAKLIAQNEGLKFYYITTYEAAKKYGSGTTWCITGRYPGQEGRGQHYYDLYINQYNLDGYYFIFDLKHKDPTVKTDYLKYCACINKSGRLEMLFNGMQNHDVIKQGIPNIDEKYRIQPLPAKIPYFDLLTVVNGEAIQINDKSLLPAEYTIPENVNKIKLMLLHDCNNLEKVIIGSSVKRIGSGAFMSCKNLKEVIIPDTVEWIGAGLFIGDPNLDTVSIPESITEIPEYTFQFTNINTLILPKTLMSVAKDSFVPCKIKNIIIDKSKEELDQIQNIEDIKHIKDVTITRPSGEIIYSNEGRLNQEQDLLSAARRKLD